MLVSDIISMASGLSNIANLGTYPAATALIDAQLAWNQIYGFLAQNDDDCFLTTKFIEPTVITTGDVANGSATITNIPSTAKMYTTALVSAASGYIPANAAISVIPGLTSITCGSSTATGSQVGDVLTIKNFIPDAYTRYLFTWTLPSDFFRLRFFAYEGADGRYNPLIKSTIQNFAQNQATPSYRVMGNTVSIFDSFGYTRYKLIYYPSPATLTTGTDLTFPRTFMPELMAYLMATEMVRRQRQDPAIFEAKAAKLWATMELQFSRDDFGATGPKNMFDDNSNLYT